MVHGNWDEIFIDPDAYLAKTELQLRSTVARHFEWLQRNVSADTQALLAGLPFMLSLRLHQDESYLLVTLHLMIRGVVRVAARHQLLNFIKYMDR